MATADQAAGALLLGVSVVVFVYYTLWVLILPFVDPKEALHQYFPARIYAIAIPCLLLVFFVSIVTLFIAITMLKSSAKKKKPKQA